jgi:hypothetical protein
MKAIRSSETSVLTRATWCHIPEDGNLRIILGLNGVIVMYGSSGMHHMALLSAFYSSCCMYFC